MRERLEATEALALCGALLALAALNPPELGSNPWPFRPNAVDPVGPLAPLVEAAGRRWDTGIARAAAILAALLAALAALAGWRRGLSRRRAAALVLAVAVLLLAPSTLLQLGLRDATAPWFHTNDSTYQIGLAGELLLDGRSPYGHDYRFSGLERFYTRDGTVPRAVRSREVALRHYAHFPGSALTAAPWRLLPAPNACEECGVQTSLRVAHAPYRPLAALATRTYQQPEVGDDEWHQVVERRLRQRGAGGVPASYDVGVVDRGEQRSDHDGDRQRTAQMLRL